MVSSKQHGARVEVASVLGELDYQTLTETLARACGAIGPTGELPYPSTVGTTIYEGGDKTIHLEKFEALPVEKKARKVALKFQGMFS
jgi:hypothetical protein